MINYLGNAEIYTDMPRVLRQFMLFASIWTLIAFVATLFSIGYSPLLSPVFWFPVALLLLGSTMLFIAITRYQLFMKQFCLQVTRNTLHEDGCLQGYIIISNATWQWKANSRIYLTLKEGDTNEAEKIIDVDSRLCPRGKHIYVHFATVIAKPLFDKSFLCQRCSRKLYVEFTYSGDTFKKSFVL